MLFTMQRYEFFSKSQLGRERIVVDKALLETLRDEYGIVPYIELENINKLKITTKRIEWN